MGIFNRPQDSADWLGEIEFFSGFTPDELTRVAELAEQREVPAGTVLIDQGDTGVDCFVIVDGEASVYIANEHIASHGRGAMVGEMALVGHRPRNASVVADTDMSVLRFSARDFRQLLDEMPKASERVMRLLHDRAVRSADGVE